MNLYAGEHKKMFLFYFHTFIVMSDDSEGSRSKSKGMNINYVQMMDVLKGLSATSRWKLTNHRLKRVLSSSKPAKLMSIKKSFSIKCVNELFC